MGEVGKEQEMEKGGNMGGREREKSRETGKGMSKGAIRNYVKEAWSMGGRDEGRQE